MKRLRPFLRGSTGLLFILALCSCSTLVCQHAPVVDEDKIGENQTGKNHQTTKQRDLETSIDRISAEPDPGQQVQTLRWSPDGARVAWLKLVYPSPSAPVKTPQQEIWSLAPAANQPSSDADAANHAARAATDHPILLASATQITNALRGTDAPIQPKLDDDDDTDSNPFLLKDFVWSQNHAALLLIGAQSLAWLDLVSGKSHVILSSDEPVSDVSLAPNNRTISFIRQHSLWLVDAEGGPSRQLAKPAHDGELEGEPDWPYRNELHLARAYTWSPNSSHIAWLETDDRAVARYTLHASNGDARQIVYPKPGGELPIIRVFVRRVTGSAPVKINLGPTRNYYVPRIAWLPDGGHLAIERLDRRQQTLDLLIADAWTGSTQLLLTEKDRYWINLDDQLYFLKSGQGFLWSSERTGFRHLYLYDMHGKQLLQLTHGDWEVNSLDAVDEVRRRIYFTATEKTPLERHLYAINLDGSGMERITHAPGTHQIRFSPDARRCADSYSNRTTPPRVLLLDPTHPVSSPIDANPVDANVISPADDSAPAVEFLIVKLHLDAEVHAILIKPANFDPARKYPVIVYLAGGPGEQLVRDQWGGPIGLWMELMARQGYMVFALDNQGTSGRGHYFEEPIHLRLGAQELGDQRDGLTYLRSLPYVDPARIGVCGWGYGGFLAVHAMLDRPVSFRAGFAGAPIVDWHFYDAVFAERYLDDPVTHADGWGSSVALENRSSLFFTGPLMVAQGTEDEFVHMENALTLQDHLLDAGKSVDFLLLADRGHRIEDPSARRLLYRRMTEFFLKNL